MLWKDRTMLLDEGENILGRGEECSLVIDATTVSRRHARVALGTAARRFRKSDPSAPTKIH